MRAYSASSAPTMMLSSPRCAASRVRATGASAKATPRSFDSARPRNAPTATVVVLRSTMTAGVRAPRVSRGCHAACRGTPLDLRPARQRQEHDVGLRRNVVERWPRAAPWCPSSAAKAAAFMSKAMTSPACLSATLRHIGPPMTPRPTKPMTGMLALHIRLRTQSIHMPPLISSDVPVIQLEAGEHRNSAACAMSSALP